MLVSVCKDPAAVGAVLDGGEEEMHIRPDPAVEGVAVLAELLRARVLDHVGVGKPDDETGSTNCAWTEDITVDS